jgi:hypothetical protein
MNTNLKAPYDLKPRFSISKIRGALRRCLTSDIPACACCPYKMFNEDKGDCSCLTFLYEDVDYYLLELFDHYMIEKLEKRRKNDLSSPRQRYIEDTTMEKIK